MACRVRSARQASGTLIVTTRRGASSAAAEEPPLVQLSASWNQTWVARPARSMASAGASGSTRRLSIIVEAMDRRWLSVSQPAGQVISMRFMVALLAKDPQTSLEQIAKAAGTSRQTVYSHFSSRDGLVEALFDQGTAEVVDALDAAGLDDLPADEALLRLTEISWEMFDARPFLLQVTAPQSGAGDEARHAPVIARLERIARRGRREGRIDPDLPVSWIVATTMALGHATGEEVRAGRLSPRRARALLRRSLPRLYSADDG